MKDSALKMNKIIKNMPFSASSILTAIFLFGSTALALAQGADEIQATVGGGSAVSTLGDMFNQGCSNTSSLATAFSYVAYGAGAMFSVMGIYHLRAHSEDSRSKPMHTPLALLGGAACLLVAPSVLTAVANSLGYTVSPTMAGCLAAGSAGSGGGQGLDVMLANFVGNIKAPLTALTQVIANVAGVFMIVRGLMKASKYGFDPKTNSVQSIMTHLAFGAILFTIGGNFSMVTSSIFGGSTNDDTSALSWSIGGTTVSPQFQNAVAAALSFIQIIGFIAFVRGWMLLKKVFDGDGQTPMAQAITHIAGGVCAVNIPAFLKAMDTTFGTNLLS